VSQHQEALDAYKVHKMATYDWLCLKSGQYLLIQGGGMAGMGAELLLQATRTNFPYGLRFWSSPSSSSSTSFLPPAFFYIIVPSCMQTRQRCRLLLFLT
jgi:hypothetical protein